MEIQKRNNSDVKTFKAHVWSPINKGEAILEISIGTTVEQLLNTLKNIWGAQFNPDAGFAYSRGIVAGWCVLCKTKDGQFYPLGIEDHIPVDPIDYKKKHPYGGWRHQVFGRVHYARNINKNTSEGILTQKVLECFYHGFHDRKNETPPGIYDESCMYNESEIFTSSSPKPKEPVDIQLAVIITVSGT